jgi:cell division protein FtsI (penicillin-binding protein 3)
MGAICARVVHLQTSQHDWLLKRARAQQQQVDAGGVERGLILDRAGRELARSVEADSFFAVPAEMDDTDSAAMSLAATLGVDRAELAERLRQGREANKQFVWIARKVDDEAGAAVRQLNIKGVHALKEPKRRYPNGELAAHILGFVDTDEAGLAGVELFQNASLTGASGRTYVEGDARRKGYESVESESRPPQTVVLTIDQTVQFLAERALQSAVESTQAKSGAAVVLDPRTGEILALANAPTFDPNAPADAPAEVRRNDALQNIYEPGSTFKVVAFSAAIEEKLAKPDDKIDCQMGSITVAGRVVHDHSAFGTLTLTEALAKSSNVAAIKLGLRVGDARMYDYITRFGFGSRTGIELPGETAGLVRNVSRWQPSSMGSIAMGQEVGVTPLQMAAAFGALANDGVRVAPHLVREIRNADGTVARASEPESHRVVSAETARTIRTMLESVTLKGTAKAAQLDGYTAAGKTGTAQKIDPKTRTYSATKHVASFVGFAPVENPSVVIIVVIDEPKGAYHGGDVAAPVFKEIAENVLPYLNVAPDSETKEQPAPALVARHNAPQESPAAKGEEALLPVEAGRVGARGTVVYAATRERSLLMPDLRGRSLRDAARICSQLGLELEARGEGLAVRQQPSVGASVEAGQVVRVEFGRND